jgi:hypothetical protein
MKSEALQKFKYFSIDKHKYEFDEKLNYEESDDFIYREALAELGKFKINKNFDETLK